MAVNPKSGGAREVVRRVRGQPTSDGAGVRMTRVIGTAALDHFDPFLLLDEFRSDDPNDYIAGFPDHPHRGFETVTFVRRGLIDHADSLGAAARYGRGDVQWMTAGRGIIHSEMPEQEEGRMAGFQLWVNLAAKDKMQPPAYRDIPPSGVPAFTLDNGAAVRVIAGSTHGVDGAVTRPTTEPLVLDITLPAGASIDVPIPPGHNAFVYAYGGQPLQVDGAPVPSEHMAILANDPQADGVRLGAEAGQDGASQVLLVAGRPLREPIAQYGPFVMNSVQELQQAFVDYQRGVLAT